MSFGMSLFYPLDLTIFHLSGEKSAQLLGGQLTNDIKSLTPGMGNYNLLLTQKGRILADCHVLRDTDACYLLTDQAFESVIFAHFEKMAPLSRVTIAKLSGKKAIHLIESDQMPKDVGFWEDRVIHGTQVMVYRSDRLGLPGMDLFFDDEGVMKQSLEEMAAEEISPQEQNILRVENGIAMLGRDVTIDNLPQESRMERALNFKKGCYLGQEVVARLEYRGHVNKVLVGLALSQTPIGTLPIPLFINGEECGKITSWVDSSKLKVPLALGYVPYKKNEVGQVFEFEGGTARLVSLPL